VRNTRSYDFHGVRLAVSADDDALGLAIDGRLRHFTAEPDGEPDVRFDYRVVPDVGRHVVPVPPAESRPVYDPPAGEVVYAPAEDRVYLDFVGRVRILFDAPQCAALVSVLESERDSLWLLSRPMFTLPLVELLKRRGLYSVHAAAASHDGRAVLIAGNTGSGKSTLAVALARAGFDFLGDDMVFLRGDGDDVRALAFPDEIDITPDSATWFAELGDLAGSEPRPGWAKHQLRAEDRFGSQFIGSSKPALIVFPRISSAEVSRLEPIGADEALLELAPNVLLTEPGSSQAHLAALGTLTRQADCYRLEAARDFDHIANLIRGKLS
jgi:hypothetical protein